MCRVEKISVLCNNMKYNPQGREEEDINELLQQYLKFRAGKTSCFLEEESFERIIDYYDENEQLNLAIEAAEAGIQQFPFSSLLLVKKADLLIASRLFAEALQILERVTVLDVSDINLYILKVEAWLGLGQIEKAKEIFNESINLFEREEKIELLFELANVFDDYELFSDVFDCLRLILLQDPQNQEALFKICFWTDYTGKFQESIELHQKLIEEYPYNHLAWFNLGTAFQGLKLYEKAIDAYLYSTAIDDKFDYAYRNLGDAYIRIKNFEEAIEALEKVLELSIPEDVIYEALGHCYEKLKDYAQARAHYRKALHMNPGDSHLYYAIAGTYMAESNWKNAIDQLQQAISIVPTKSKDYHFALAQCYNKTGKLREAIDSMLQYLHYKPSSMKGWKEMILILFENEYYKEAFKQCDTAYELTRGKMIFMYYKAAAGIKSGKRKEALLILDNALRKAPRLLKEFIALDPSFLQRVSVVRVINAHISKKENAKKKNK